MIPFVTQDTNAAKEFHTVKLKPIDLEVCLLLITIGSYCKSWINHNVTN